MNITRQKIWCTMNMIRLHILLSKRADFVSLKIIYNRVAKLFNIVDKKRMRVNQQSYNIIVRLDDNLRQLSITFRAFRSDCRYSVSFRDTLYLAYIDEPARSIPTSGSRGSRSSTFFHIGRGKRRKTGEEVRRSDACELHRAVGWDPPNARCVLSEQNHRIISYHCQSLNVDGVVSNTWQYEADELFIHANYFKSILMESHAAFKDRSIIIKERLTSDI